MKFYKVGFYVLLVVLAAMLWLGGGFAAPVQAQAPYEEQTWCEQVGDEGTSAPVDCIRDRLERGFFITDIETVTTKSNTVWFVVMSKPGERAQSQPSQRRRPPLVE